MQFCTQNETNMAKSSALCVLLSLFELKETITLKLKIINLNPWQFMHRALA